MTPQRLFDFVPLAIQSLTQPRAGLRVILNIPAQRVDLINAAWLVIVLNLIFAQLFFMLAPLPAEGAQDPVPLTSSVIQQALSLFGGAFVMHRVGGMFGGKGSFDDCLTVVIWVSFILLIVQLPVPFAVLMGPQILALVMMLIVIIGMVQVTAQVMEIHGFTQVFPVLLGIIGTMMLFGIVLLVVLSLLGVSVPIETNP